MARQGAGRAGRGGAGQGRPGQGRGDRGSAKGPRGGFGDAGRGGRGAGRSGARDGRGSGGYAGRDGVRGREGTRAQFAQKGSAASRGGARGPESRGGSPRARADFSAQRSGARGDLIEGRRATDEALELGLPITRALVQKDGGQGDPSLSQLAARLEAAGIEVERVPKPVLDSLSSHGAHQGVMLRVRPYRYAELADVIERAGEGPALVIVLDHVTDEGNFGAIVRTAEVVGAAGVVVARARAARVGVGAYKTSAGAVMHLPIAQVPNLANALDELKEHGFWAAAATEHAHDVIWDAPLAGRVALVMGSEGSGISRLVCEHCDFGFRLPQRGRVESLNVAQATTAIAYEWLRRVETGDGTDGAASVSAAPGLAADSDLSDASEFAPGADFTDAPGLPTDSALASDLDFPDTSDFLPGSDFPDTSDFLPGADFPDTSEFDFSDGDLRG